MSDHTLRSLFDLIASNRQGREGNTRTLERVPPFERQWWSMQIAVFDQEFRNQLDAIEEVPGLLARAPQLQEGWPYPPNEVLQAFRAEIAHRSGRSVREVDELPLREVVAILAGRTDERSPLQETPPRRREITEADVAALPRWARVAFAARCARRDERILAAVAPQTPPDELSGVELAVRLAEESAAAGQTVPGTTAAAGRVMEQAHRAKKPGEEPIGWDGASKVANLLRGTIGSAAASAALAAEEGTPSTAFDAYLMAAQAAHVVSSTPLLEGMRRDFGYLHGLAQKEKWTDQTPVPPSIIPQPQLRLVGLSIRNLRAIRKLDLPQDGLGWNERMPDLVLLGGINGSGKTTLLNYIIAATELLTAKQQDDVPNAALQTLSQAERAWLEFTVSSCEMKPFRFRIVVGDRRFIDSHSIPNHWALIPSQGRGGGYYRQGNELLELSALISDSFARTTIPSAVFLPSEDRTLIVPGEDYKAAGKLADFRQFAHRWRPPTAWKDSLEALLYSLRWEDLNAKEEGRFTDLSHFSAYADAFRRFTGESKFLKFEEGKLVVKIAGSNVVHNLAELSSGERQVLLLTGELLRYWRPGSLVLIDEPELHLHSTWQTKLYEALRYWQAERGGQIICATQSSHFFHISEPGTAALLGVDTL